MASKTGYQIPTTGPVRPREIYELLLQSGLSTPQALGVMGNMEAESGLDPESGGTDTNGFWAGGLISWNSQDYPNAHQLVTGNPQQDVRAQIGYLLSNTNGINAGLQGSTPADVAGNFASNVEVCQGCQKGSNYPNGWAARRQFATMIAGWETSGKWPTKAGGSVGPGQGGGTGAASSSKCLISVPLAGCILSSSSGRGIVGGLMLAAALPVTAVGVVVLAALAFRRTGAGTAVGRSAEVVGGAVAAVPGLSGAGAAVAAAGSAEARSSQRAAAQRQERDQAAAERHTAAQYRRQSRARANYDRDSERDQPPF